MLGLPASSTYYIYHCKHYNVGEHDKSVEEKRDKAELSLCFSSVLHVLGLFFIV